MLHTDSVLVQLNHLMSSTNSLRSCKYYGTLDTQHIPSEYCYVTQIFSLISKGMVEKFLLLIEEKSSVVRGM